MLIFLTDKFAVNKWNTAKEQEYFLKEKKKFWAC